MTVQHKKVTLALYAVFLLGCVLRFRPGILTGFPVNDGGMLIAMVRDLRSNEFLLPFVTSYNYSDIPFAYPPFGMYLGAILSAQLSIPDVELLRWLPPLISVAIIPAFYWLTRQILGSTTKAFIATALYAVMPASSDWMIMGGGLTRSLGILFSLLAIGHLYHLFHDGGDKKTLGLAILFSSLTVLSHPEVGLQTAVICFVLWTVYARNVSGLRNLFILGFSTILLTAFWWLTVLYFHGFAPFWSAMHTGIHETLLASLFSSFFSLQGGLPILTLLKIVGIFVVVRKSEILLILWTFIPFLVDPRNGPAIALFPSLMLAAEGGYHLNMEFFRASSQTFPQSGKASRYLFFLTNGIFVVILLYFYLVSFRETSNLVSISLSPSDRETMSWIKENTPEGSKFLLITNRGQISPMADSFQEWFPVLAERQSRNTLQGLEWILGPRFFEYSKELIDLQTCPDVHCLNDWLEQKDFQVDFILFQKKRVPPTLMNSLREDSSYILVYSSASAEIFAFQQE